MSKLLQGIVHDMPIGQYHAQQGLSSSGVSDILKSPAHYRKKVWTDTKDKRIGSAVHVLLLEPERVGELLPTAPNVNKRTKDGKAEFAAWEEGLHADATILSSDERALAEACAEAVREHPYVKNLRLFDPVTCQHEISAFFEIKTDAGMCQARARYDILSSALACAFDIKTCQDADGFTLRRHAENYGWHRQAALYIRAADTLGIDLRDERFVFIAVEKSPPYGVRLVAYDDDAIAQGDRDIMRAAEIWARCTASGEWPCYPREIGTLHLSPWMIDSE